jgi:ribosomal protein L37AE/L43A
MNYETRPIERDGDDIPKCEECGSSNWSKDGSGLAAGLFSCGDCGYLPKAWRRERIREAVNG